MSMDSVSLSVIVPTFNESSRFREPLRIIAKYLCEQDYSSEIVVVDDGSDDDTFELVRELAGSLPVPVSIHRYTPNRGKGHALKVGFEAARGRRLLFTDADLSTPIETTADLLAALDSGAGLAIGSRWLTGANIEKHQPWYREWMGTVFTILVNALITRVSDATCGFKAFEGEVGRDLFARLRIYDWSFDAELLFLASRRGYDVAQVPVRWEDREGTRVSLVRDAVKSLIGLFRIRLNSALGRYERRHPSLAPSEVFRSNPEPVAFMGAEAGESSG